MDKLLSIQQVADILGVTKMTVRRMMAKGKFTPIQLGKRLVRISESELKNQISASTAKPGNMVPTVDIETGK